MGLVLFCCGAVAVAVGTWRGYANARGALEPVVHDGDPTRAAVEAGRPLLERTRVRRAVRSVLAAIAWLSVAMYGLFLVASAETVR